MNSRDEKEFDVDVTLVDVPSPSGGADPLALFESESEPDQFESEPGPDRTSAPPVLGGTETLPSARLVRVPGPMTLDQVLRRLGSVTWAEAVAIVEGLCRVLIAGGRMRVPEMSGVAITAAGGVTVGTGGVKDAPGPLLARMLHTMAAAGSVPAPLRLFITKWASASEAHPIGEFAKDLAYFSRPDGQSLIQAVYERAVATVPVEATPRPTATRKVQPARPPQRQDSRRLYAAAAAVVLLGVAATAVFTWRGTGSSSPFGWPLQSTSTQVETELATTLAAGTSPEESVSEPASVSRAAVRSAPGSAAPGARTSPSALPVRPQVRAAGAPAPAPVSSAVRATLASPTASSPRSAAPPPSPAGASRSVAVTPTPSRTARRDVTGPPIYSRSDPDVTPPAFLQPQLPAQLLSGRRPDMNTLELIVSEAGTVERVRLLSTPKRMADMMLLSGAKNWEFEPALKDGQSVRYRLELSWAATP